MHNDCEIGVLQGNGVLLLGNHHRNSDVASKLAKPESKLDSVLIVRIVAKERRSRGYSTIGAQLRA